jgi:hypothetical protein
MFAISSYRKSPNTAFSKNVDSGNGYMVKYITVHDTIVPKMYAKLAAYAKTVQALLDQYAAGNILLVANMLSLTVYNQMSIDLYNLAQNPTTYPDYEILRTSITSSLSGLYQSILQHQNLVDLESQLTSAEKCCDILKDPVKLQDYINNLRRTKSILPSTVVTMPTVSIKPQYAEYIRLYGYPDGGVFNMDRLAPLAAKYANVTNAPSVL